MIQKFEQLASTLQDIERRLSDSTVISKQQLYQDLLKQHKHLKEGVDLYLMYKDLTHSLEDANVLLQDPEMKQLAQQEIDDLSNKLDVIKHDLQLFLIPKDPDDDKPALIEIRSGTGGEEAALFSYELFRMYSRFSESKGWKIDVIDKN